MTVWTVVMLHFSFFVFFFVAVILYLSSVHSYILLLIPFYNFFFVVTVHTSFIHTQLLMSTPVSALPVDNYGFVCVEFC
jgi:hypothetical protein